MAPSTTPPHGSTYLYALASVPSSRLTRHLANSDTMTDEEAASGMGPETTRRDGDPDADYGGLFGAIRYAYGRSDSLLVRSYAIVGTLLAALVAVLFVQALVVILGRTVGVGGGTFTFSRAFVVVVALAVIGPLLAPMVSTARRHRHGTGGRRTDRRMAALGYVFVGALYLALVVSAPPELRESVNGPFAPVVETLYALPWYVGLLAPAAVALAMWLVHRRA